jgi:glycosyltransferase involved in cell wall biosynthesis
MTKRTNNVPVITHINLAKGFRGGERQTLLLIQELSKHGYEQLFVTRVDSEVAKRVQALNLRNIKFVAIAKPYALHLNHLKQSSLIHAHETKAAQVAFFANLFYKIPYIITRRVDNPIKKNFFNQKIYENASYTVVLSHAIEEQTRKISDAIKIKTIPSAFSALSINEENVNQLKKRFVNKFLIGNIGELDNTHKGQYYLIEAAKILEKKYPDMHFIFLGKGKDAQNYKEQAKELTNITFEGFVNNVGDYIACFNLFVFPSLNEGLGSILFDVMQQKVPIIASDVGGIPDIIVDRENGLLVPPKDTHAIANAIEKLYKNHDEATNLAERAYADIDEFSKEKMCERYIKLYEEMI